MKCPSTGFALLALFCAPAIAAEPLWWQRVFSLAFDGHGNYVTLENLIQPGGRTIWLGDWQFLQPPSSPPLKTSPGKPLPTAADFGLPPFPHPLTGEILTDEAEFWRTRSAATLLGKQDAGIRHCAAIPDDLATALDLKNVTTQRDDGQWLIESGESMLYDAPFGEYQAAKARRAMLELAPDMIHYDDWDLRSPTMMTAKADIHVRRVNRVGTSHRFRLLVKHGVWELYLDDLYVQTYITGTTSGRMGLFAKSGPVEFTDLRCWAMTPEGKDK